MLLQHHIIMKQSACTIVLSDIAPSEYWAHKENYKLGVIDMKKYVESCNRCGKVFKSKSIIVAVYGMLFCSNECAFEELPDLNETDLETVLASDIGVE